MLVSVNNEPVFRPLNSNAIFNGGNGNLQMPVADFKLKHRRFNFGAKLGNMHSKE